MAAYPKKLHDLLDVLAEITDEHERAQILIDYAETFKPVPERIAKKPYTEDHRVKYCESEAYVWAVVQPDHTLNFYFAVENPSGISAKALAAILDKTLSGENPESVAEVSQEIVEKIFRQNISMGKGMGLMSMVQVVGNMAKEFVHRQHAAKEL